jgi:predicted nucleotidyltransferase
VSETPPNKRFKCRQPLCNEQVLLRSQLMLTREKVTAVLREKHPYLVSEYGVKRIGLFGSYAKGVPNEMSDIDIVVEFERPIGFKFIEFAEYLESLLGKRVDVLTHAGVRGIRIARIAKDIEENIEYV